MKSIKYSLILFTFSFGLVTLWPYLTNPAQFIHTSEFDLLKGFYSFTCYALWCVYLLLVLIAGLIVRRHRKTGGRNEILKACLFSFLILSTIAIFAEVNASRVQTRAWEKKNLAHEQKNQEREQKNKLRLNELNVAIIKNSKDTALLLERGRLLSSHEAIADFNRVLALEPKNVFAHYGIALAFSNTKQYRDCIVHLEALLKMPPEQRVPLSSWGAPLGRIESDLGFCKNSLEWQEKEKNKLERTGDL